MFVCGVDDEEDNGGDDDEEDNGDDDDEIPGSPLLVALSVATH